MAQNRSIKMLSFSQQWGLQRTLSKKTEKIKISQTYFCKMSVYHLVLKKKLQKINKKFNH